MPAARLLCWQQTFLSLFLFLSRHTFVICCILVEKKKVRSMREFSLQIACVCVCVNAHEMIDF